MCQINKVKFLNAFVKEFSVTNIVVGVEWNWYAKIFNLDFKLINNIPQTILNVITRSATINFNLTARYVLLNEEISNLTTKSSV